MLGLFVFSHILLFSKFIKNVCVRLWLNYTGKYCMKATKLPLLLVFNGVGVCFFLVW